REDKKEKIEKWKRWEERLLKILEGKEPFIKGLEENVDEGWDDERDLKRMLAEAERRAEEAEQRLGEAEESISASKGTGVEGIVQKPGDARAGRSGWEFGRSKE
ncbi:MAG: hypothetical protein Q9217_006657, partial [Psora testacea]